MLPVYEGTVTQERWSKLNEQVRGWWDSDMHTANEEDVRRDPGKTLLYLPWPYSSAGGSEAIFPEMYAWDTYFINLALLKHWRSELVRYHILNYLFMIERHGFMLNGNRTFYVTRSQTPVFPHSIWLYYQATGDRDILHRAYPVLKQEYSGYWLAEHHQTPTGLATNRDLGDVGITPVLAAEAETGLDFNSLYDADVRECTPLITNCALVQYANVLAEMADVLGEEVEAERWRQDAAERGQRVRELCWDEEQGFFFEYNFVKSRQNPYWSLCAYWTMWAGIATSEQAEGLVRQLDKFETAYGVTVTDQQYPSPHKEFAWVQWGYPAGWPPLHIIMVEALDRYGYQVEAERIAKKYLGMVVGLYEQTGSLYEKYNVVEGNVTLPVERQHDVPAMHGWSSAAAVLLGLRVFAS